jgi:hypothetical protein
LKIWQNWRMKTYLQIAMILLASGFCFADELPEAPAPKLLTVHRFVDTQNKIAFASMVSMRTADTVQTCYLMAAVPGRERQLPTQSCAGIVAFNVAFSIAGAGTAYLLHRTGHYRLERIPMWISFAGAAQGVEYSSIH